MLINVRQFSVENGNDTAISFGTISFLIARALKMSTFGFYEDSEPRFRPFNAGRVVTLI